MRILVESGRKLGAEERALIVSRLTPGGSEVEDLGGMGAFDVLLTLAITGETAQVAAAIIALLKEFRGGASFDLRRRRPVLREESQIPEKEVIVSRNDGTQIRLVNPSADDIQRVFDSESL